MYSNTRYYDEVLGLNHRALEQGIITINRKLQSEKQNLGICAAHVCEVASSTALWALAQGIININRKTSV